MPDARRPLLAILIASAAGSTGCSLMAVRSPPAVVADPSRPFTTCDSPPVPTVADTVMFAGYGVFFASALSQDKITPTATVLSGLLLGTLAASAIHGFRVGHRCAELQALGARCRAGDREACLALNPGFDPARPAVPLLCAQDADCAAGQACVQSACVDRPAPAPQQPRPPRPPPSPPER